MKFIYCLLLCFSMYAGNISNWRNCVVLQPTEKKTAKTAVLIIACPTYGKDPVTSRWNLGKKVWEQYMNSHPQVDCYFLVPRYSIDSKEDVTLEENTIYVDVSHFSIDWQDRPHVDYILHKTIKAIEYLLPKKYTHYIRTNLNAFVNLKNINEYNEIHHESMYSTPIWQEAWYTIGYSIFFTSDVAQHMVNEYNRLYSVREDFITPYRADDGALTSLATGVWPYGRNPFQCSPKLRLGTRQVMCEDSLLSKRFSKYGLLLTPLKSLSEGIKFCEEASPTVMLYRIKDDLNNLELAELYEYLLNKTYPNLNRINIVDFFKEMSR
jgi:hypothetical protein